MPGALTRRNFLSLDFGDRRSPGDRWVRVHRIAMACRFEVMLPSSDAIDMDAARGALDEADEVDAMLTVFRPGGGVAEVNRRASDGPVPLSTALFGLLARSVELHAATGGAFDVTAAPLKRCWESGRRDGRVPEEAELQDARASVGLRYVSLDQAAQTATFTGHDVELNFEAIAKGYALDRMEDVLRGHGGRRALLSAGRNTVLAMGGRGRGWPIEVPPQFGRGPARRVWIREGAFGTSDQGVDPRSGQPAHGVLAASVVTRDAATAGALSSAFVIGGPLLAEAYCETHPGTLAILVADDGAQPPRVFGRYDGATLETVS